MAIYGKIILNMIDVESIKYEHTCNKYILNKLK